MVVFDKASIAALRNVKALSQAEFAELIGKQAQSVALWESGYCLPSLQTIIDICNRTDVPISFFFSTVSATVESDE